MDARRSTNSIRFAGLWRAPKGARSAGARTLHLVGDERIVFSQGKARVGQWYLTNASGALLRSLEWLPTSANPQPTAPAAVGPAFTEIKAFWKAQLGKPVR